MALRGLKMGLALVLATALWAGVSAQSGCTTAIISLSPCLNYMTGNSSTPSSSCCTQLSSVVTNQAQCLCTLLNSGGSSLGLNLNQTQALALPGACNVKTPPLSQCNAVSPSASPGPSPTDTPASPATPAATVPSTTTPPATTTPTTNPSTTPTVPSGKGSTNVPGTNRASSSDARSTAIMPLSLLSSLLFIASYVSLARF
ncbi:hypothetical protein AAC387_Pa07g2587 [Persea americana]